MFGRHRASKDPKAYIEELQKRRVKAFGTVQAPLYNGHIKAIILVDGVKHRVPQSAWGEDNAELTFKSGYATIETPLRRHGRVLFDQASAEGWLKGQSAEMPSATIADESKAEKWFQAEVAAAEAQRMSRDD